MREWKRRQPLKTGIEEGKGEGEEETYVLEEEKMEKGEWELPNHWRQGDRGKEKGQRKGKKPKQRRGDGKKGGRGKGECGKT